MSLDVRVHMRANLEARLRALDFPMPESGYFDGGILLDLIWPEQAVAVMLGWPGRDPHNLLVIAGWRLIYFEGSEVFTRACLETIGAAIGYVVPQPVKPEPIAPSPQGLGYVPR